LAKSLGSLGLTGSVTNPADLQRLVDQTMQQYGPIPGIRPKATS
jgi:hypothetical protein